MKSIDWILLLILAAGPLSVGGVPPLAQSPKGASQTFTRRPTAKAQAVKDKEIRDAYYARKTRSDAIRRQFLLTHKPPPQREALPASQMMDNEWRLYWEPPPPRLRPGPLPLLRPLVPPPPIPGR